jgi:hypothetical protein
MGSRTKVLGHKGSPNPGHRELRRDFAGRAIKSSREINLDPRPAVCQYIAYLETLGGQQRQAGSEVALAMFL